MINKQQCYFKYFSSRIISHYIQIGKQSLINANDYPNPIVKISLLSSNNLTIEKKQIEDLGKDDSLHLKLLPKHSDVKITLNDCNSQMSIVNSNFNELSIELVNSSVHLKEKVSKPLSNLSINLLKSGVEIDSIDSLNSLSLKAKLNSRINIKALSSNSIKAEVEGDNEFKCLLLKIKDNSLLHYSNDTKLFFRIHCLALWTLINVYCANRKKFINLPLGVFGGRIGSTSFPTLILFNKDEHSKLIGTLHEPLITPSKRKMKVGLVGIALGLLWMYKAYFLYRFSNEAFTRCKLSRYQMKKCLI